VYLTLLTSARPWPISLHRQSTLSLHSPPSLSSLSFSLSLFISSTLTNCRVQPPKEEEEASTSEAAEGEAPKEGSRRWGRFWGRRSPVAKTRPSPKSKSLAHVKTAPARTEAAVVAADKGIPHNQSEPLCMPDVVNKSA
jgi:hypothetical protein